MRVHQQKAYILLNRPYSETSWIVEIFSREFGRLALMAKGARRLKSKQKGVLIPFQPTLLSWTGKGEIPTLTSAEIDISEFDLGSQEIRGDGLVCGFYCNELLVNLLHRHDPHAQLYDNYHSTIMQLASPANASNLTVLLRGFERQVMKETGYEIDFLYEADGKTALLDDAHYCFQPGQGFVRLAGQQYNSVLGAIIKSLASDAIFALSSEQQSQGKRLMRDILGQSMGRKQIISRALFYPKPRSS
ncbi:DNA repair protein RecO [Arenicella xantha]|uniref:DNA repair protein RecO n=1 Tax=Arenicella xantha TaxID=644221 RepID=A0A395JN05_9GAMM|nr:DNA repair protein RecO [Arenicella xantha]RBP49274.1 DNA replication and repair protein RecO [Arenicella xantha]